MSARMKKRHTKPDGAVIRMYHGGNLYEIPKKIAEKYRIKKSIPANEVFKDINTEFTKAGALLQGIRARENLTQAQLAELIQVTQSDISQMENGTRVIGRQIAKRIETCFGVNYRHFLF